MAYRVTPAVNKKKEEKSESPKGSSSQPKQSSVKISDVANVVSKVNPQAKKTGGSSGGLISPAPKAPGVSSSSAPSARIAAPTQKKIGGMSLSDVSKNMSESTRDKKGLNLAQNVIGGQRGWNWYLDNNGFTKVVNSGGQQQRRIDVDITKVNSREAFEYIRSNMDEESAALFDKDYERYVATGCDPKKYNSLNSKGRKAIDTETKNWNTRESNMDVLRNVGLMDVNGNPIDPDKAPPSAVEAGINLIADPQARAEAWAAYKKLTKTDKSRFYNISLNGKYNKYLDDANFTQKDFNTAVESFNKSFAYAEGEENAQRNADAYLDNYEYIKNTYGDNPRVYKTLLGALNKSFESRTNTKAPTEEEAEKQIADNAAKAAEKKAEEESQKQKGPFDWIGDAISSVFGGGNSKTEEEQEDEEETNDEPVDNGIPLFDDEEDEYTPEEDESEDEETGTFGEGGGGYEAAAEETADGSSAFGPMPQRQSTQATAEPTSMTIDQIIAQGRNSQKSTAQEEKRETAEVHDLGEAWSIYRKGDGDTLPEEWKKEVASLVNTSAGQYIVGKFTDEAGRDAEAGNITEDMARYRTIGMLGRQVSDAMLRTKSSEFPSDLAAQIEPAVIMAVNEADKAFEKGWTPSNPEAIRYGVNMYDAYFSEHPEAFSGVQQIMDAYSQHLTDMAQAAESAEAAQVERERKAIDAVMSGTYTFEDMNIALAAQDKNGGFFNQKDATYKTFMDTLVYDYFQPDNAEGYYTSDIHKAHLANGVVKDDEYAAMIQAEAKNVLTEAAKMSFGASMGLSEFMPNMDVNTIVRLADARIQEIGGSLTPSEEEALEAIGTIRNESAGGEGIGMGEAAKLGAYATGQNIKQSYMSAWYDFAAQTDTPRDSAKIANKYSQYDVDGRQMYKHDLLALANSGELSEQMSKGLLDAIAYADDIYDIGIDPEDLSGVRQSAATSRQNLQAVSDYVYEHGTADERMMYDMVLNTGTNMAQFGISAASSIALGGVGGFIAGYGVSQYGNYVDEGIAAGYGLYGSKYYALGHVATDAMANTVTEGMIGQVTGLGAAAQVGSQQAGKKGLARVLDLGWEFIKNDLGENKDNFSEEVHWQFGEGLISHFAMQRNAAENRGRTINYTLSDALDGMVKAVANGVNNLDPMQAAKDTADQFVQTCIYTAPMALFGAASANIREAKILRESESYKEAKNIIDGTNKTETEMEVETTQEVETEENVVNETAQQTEETEQATEMTEAEKVAQAGEDAKAYQETADILEKTGDTEAAAWNNQQAENNRNYVTASEKAGEAESLAETHAETADVLEQAGDTEGAAWNREEAGRQSRIAENYRRFMKALENDLKNPQFREVMNKAGDALNRAAEVARCAREEDAGGNLAKAAKAKEQADRHAEREAMQEKRMQGAQAMHDEKTNAIMNGDTSDDTVQAALDAAEEWGKAQTERNAARKEKEQKQAEYDAAMEQHMVESRKKANDNIRQQNDLTRQRIEEEAKARAESGDAQLKALSDERMRIQQEIDAMEAQSENGEIDMERFEALMTRAGELEVQMEDVEERILSTETDKAMKKVNAGNMESVYQTLAGENLYVNPSQVSDILNATGLKSIQQVNRRYGFKLTTDDSKTVNTLDNTFSQIADYAPGYFTEEDMKNPADALIRIGDMKKQTGRQASIGQTGEDSAGKAGNKNPVWQEMASTVKKATGVDVIASPMNDDVRGYYDPETNTIYVNTKVTGETGRRTVIAHELAHFMEGSKNYDAVAKAIIKAAYDGNQTLENADRKEIRDRYDGKGISYSEDHELVAAAMERIIEGDQAVFNRLMESGNKGLLTRIYGAMKQFLAKVSARLKGDDAYRQYQQVEDAVKMMRQAIADQKSFENGQVQNNGNNNKNDVEYAIGRRQFNDQTAQRSELLYNKVKKQLADEAEYETDSGKAQIQRALDRMESEGFEASTDYLLAKAPKEYTTDDNVLAIAAIEEAKNRDDVDMQYRIAAVLGEAGTEQGRALQARKLVLGKLDTANVLGDTAKRVKEANRKRGMTDKIPLPGDKPLTKAKTDAGREVIREAKKTVDAITQKVGTDGVISTDNPWNTPLADWKMELIRKYGLMNEALPGVHYNKATLKQRQLAAIVATDNDYRGNDLLTLTQQLEFMKKGFAVPTEADLGYITTMMAEVIAEQGDSETEVPESRAGKIALSRMYEAQANIDPAKLSEKMSSLAYMNMLSGTTTWVKNIMSNVVTNPMEVVSENLAAAMDKALSNVTGARTTGATRGVFDKNQRKAFSGEIANTWRDYVVDKADTSHSHRYDINGDARVYQNEWMETARNIVDFAMQIGDRPFYEAAYEEQYSNLKRIGATIVDEETGERRIMTDAEMKAEANARALNRVFQEDRKVIKWLGEMKSDPTFGPFFNTIIPFIATPTNVAVRMAEYSPVGLAYSLVKRGLYNGVMGKGQFNQRDFVLGVGRGLTGSGLIMAGMALASSGIIKFGRSDEDEKKRTDVEKSLGMPYSMYIEIGGKKHEIEWALPMAGLISVGARAYNALTEDNGENTAMQLMGSVVSGLGNTLFDNSFLSSVNDIFKGYDDGMGIAERVSKTMLESYVNQMLSPSFMRQWSKATDPYIRDTSDSNYIMQVLKKNVIQNWPVLREMLPIKTDVTGEAMKGTQAYGWGTGEQNAVMHMLDCFMSPTQTISEKNDQALIELLDLSYQTGQATFLPQQLIADNKYVLNLTKTYAKNMRIGDSAIKMVLSDEEKRQANADYGRLLFDGDGGRRYKDSKGGIVRINGLRDLMESSKWARMTEEEKMKAVSDMKAQCAEVITVEMAKKLKAEGRIQ